MNSSLLRLVDRNTRLLYIAYAIGCVFTLLTAFNFVPSPPIVTYLSLVVLYLTALVLGLTPDASPRLQMGLVFLTPFVVALIVIDPTEPGLYGYDPYPTLETLALYRKGQIASALNEFGAWPGFYYFIILLHTVVDLPYSVIAKYIPFVTTLTPFIVYAGFRRYTDDYVAFLIAITLSGVKAITGFELKFVDEIVASLLFFVLVGLLVKYEYIRPARRQHLLLVAVPTAAGLIITHHYVSFLLTVFLVVWLVVGWIHETEFDLKQTLRLRLQGSVAPLTWLVMMTVFVTGFMFLVAAPEFAGRVLSSEFLELRSLILDTIPQSSTAEGSPNGGSSPTPSVTGSSTETNELPPSYQSALQVADSDHHSSLHRPLLVAFNVPLVGLTLLAGVAVWRTTDIVVRRLGTIAVGLYAVFFSLIFFGGFLPIDPSRTVLYLYFSSIAAVALWTAGSLSRRHFRSVGTVVAITVIVTNVALISAPVVNSSPAEATLIEDHPSIEQLSASNWYKKHGQETVQAYEPGLWKQYDEGPWASRYSKRYGSVGYCVWRRDAGIPEYSQHNKIHTTGSFSIFSCSQYGR